METDSTLDKSDKFSSTERGCTEATQIEQKAFKPDSKRYDRCYGFPHKRTNCPPRNSRRDSCGKMGHWKKTCRSKRVNEVPGEICPNSSDDKDKSFLGEICVEAVNSNSTHDMPWKAVVSLNK